MIHCIWHAETMVQGVGLLGLCFYCCVSWGGVESLSIRSITRWIFDSLCPSGHLHHCRHHCHPWLVDERGNRVGQAVEAAHMDSHHHRGLVGGGVFVVYVDEVVEFTIKINFKICNNFGEKTLFLQEKILFELIYT